MKVSISQYLPRRIIAAMLCCVVALSVATTAFSEELTADKLLNLVQMTATQRKALLSGEILAVSTGDEASEDVTKSNLFSGLVTWVRQPLEKTVATLKSPAFKIGDKKIWQLTDTNPFPGIQLGPSDKREAERILKFSEGDTVNLSVAELRILKGLGLSSPLNPIQLATFSKAYTRILEDRFRTYRKKGITGIVPYTRGKGKSDSPGEHLQAVTDITVKSLGRFAPEFFEDIRQYPDATQRPQQHLLFRDNWEGRPQFILVHRMVDIEEAYAFFMQREYFVSHGYDALQAIIICAPYGGGTLIGMATDVLTGKVAGFASGIAHNIGRKQVRSKAEIRLREIKAMIEGK